MKSYLKNIKLFQDDLEKTVERFYLNFSQELKKNKISMSKKPYTKIFKVVNVVH